jgi:hypothetical protein
MLLNFVTCRPDPVFDHLFDQLLVWFVYIHDSSLFIQQPSKLLRALKVKALRRRECLGDCVRELGRVGSGQYDLYSGRRAYTK